MKKLWIAAVLAARAVSIVGCGSAQKEQFGDKKEDWEKTAPPPQYKGPGQPGGPQSGPSTPPPPANPG